MRLEHPLFLLLLIPTIAALVLMWRRTPATMRVSTLRAAAIVPRTLKVRLRRAPDVLRIVALVTLCFALSRPQIVDREVLAGEGIDIMIAFDLSGSMNAVDMTAEEIARVQGDGREPPNRFEVARQILKDFIRHRQSDRIGLVIFGPEAYLRFPPTLDYTRVLNALDELVLDDGRRDSPEGECKNGCTISGAGTAIGDALNRAFLRLESSNARSRIVILITDGKQEGGAMDPLTVPKYVATLPGDKQVRIYTFLVGGGTETRIPAVDPLRGATQVDARGRVVYERPPRPFPTDPELLKQIASLTSGRAYESYDYKKFRLDFADLEKSTFETKVQVNRKELFWPFVLGAFVALAMEALARRTWLRTFP